jgi:phosphodiesterase/alkaline phosphatase D-like protein
LQAANAGYKDAFVAVISCSDPIPIGLPTVTNGIGATLVKTNSARLNGEITDTGGQNPSVTIYWGTSDGGTNIGLWTQQLSLGNLGKQTFSRDISGLNPGTKYYYRCYASNSAGASWASSTETFTTDTKASVLISLQAANGQYVCAEGGGGREVVANRDAWRMGDF